MRRTRALPAVLLLLAAGFTHGTPAAPASSAAGASVPTGSTPPAAVPAAFSLNPPAQNTEAFGEHDDFPYLARVPGATLLATTIADDGLDVTTLDDAEPHLVGSRRVTKRYEGAPGTTPDTFMRTYATALRNAGWAVTAQQDRSRGTALVVAHYAAGGRDVWARLSAEGSRFELSVADAAEGIASAFAQGCRLVLYGIRFDFDESAPLAESEPALHDVQRLLHADSTLRLEIVAHADSRDGDHEANLKLSKQRAAAIKLWFVRHRIDGDRLTTRGAGDTEPLRPSDTDENRARNRRIELRKPDCR
jgi:outer membrane protein OmpA-like peptidoglycan-associated protein